MSPAGPGVADERALVLRARKLPVADVPWRTNGVLWSLVFFALTALALAAAFWLLGELRLPKGWIAGAMALALAEYLIRRHRFFGTGVESALWIGGLVAVILGLKGSGKPEALLLFVAAAAIAGFRMRNAAFGAAAAVLVVAYLAARGWHVLAATFGLSVSLAALAAITREVRRPSTEWLLCGLLVITPVAGAVASAGTLSAVWAGAYLVAATACLAVGIAARAHAPLVTAAVHGGIAVATLVVHDLLPGRPEWQLIAGGAVALVLSAALSRRLRGRTTGIVLTPETLTPFDETLQTAGAIALQAQPASGPVSTRDSDGRFGGAGASGRF